jgi:hypothetical protein
MVLYNGILVLKKKQLSQFLITMYLVNRITEAPPAATPNLSKLPQQSAVI